MSEQSLGRVMPIFKGNYESSTAYSRLDTVYYPVDGCSWVCLQDATAGIPPTDNNGFWQRLAAKGDQGIQGLTGGFGQPTVHTETLMAGSSASVNITVDSSSPSEAKIFQFNFGLPAGPYGFDLTSGEVKSVSAADPMQLIPTLNTNSTNAGCVTWPSVIDLNFDQTTFYDYAIEQSLSTGEYDFVYDADASGWKYNSDVISLPSYGITYTIDEGDTLEDGDLIKLRYGGRDLHFTLNMPAAREAAVASVDGLGPTLNSENYNNVSLSAVRYVQQDLLDWQQSIARQNIGAQASGSYLASTGSAMTGVLEIYSNNITDGEVPSITQVGNKINFTDASHSQIGYVQNKFVNTGNQVFEFGTTRTIDELIYNNSLGIGIDEDGNNIINLSDSGAWRNALQMTAGTGTPKKDTPDGNPGESGLYACADHAHPLNIDTTNSPPSDSINATAGSASTYALSDHQHRLNVAIQGISQPDSGNGTVGASPIYARLDHVHALNSSIDVDELQKDGNESLGNTDTYALTNHVHPANVDLVNPEPLGTVSPGDSLIYARRNHVHPLPSMNDFTTGTLPISRGGTGANTSLAIRENLGVTIAPAKGSTIAYAGQWVQGATSYTVAKWSQEVSIVGTNKSIIDLTPSPKVLSIMIRDGVSALTIENDNGTFIAWALDAKPTTDLNPLDYTRTELL